MIYRFTSDPLPKRNFLLPVAKANPEGRYKWRPFIETWKRHDLDPDTDPSDYPLWRWHYNIHYRPEDSVEYVQRAVEIYKDIKENGFTYNPPIIRAYGPPWNHLHTGHLRISILQHLEPNAVIEVAGYDRPPPQKFR